MSKKDVRMAEIKVVVPKALQKAFIRTTRIVNLLDEKETDEVTTDMVISYMVARLGVKKAELILKEEEKRHGPFRQGPQ